MELFFKSYWLATLVIVLGVLGIIRYAIKYGYENIKSGVKPFVLVMSWFLFISTLFYISELNKRVNYYERLIDPKFHYNR